MTTIGIVSDTHGSTKNAQQAAAILHEHDIQRVFHCGDVTTAEVVEVFDDFDITFVFGNMDRNGAIRKAAQDIGSEATYEYTTTIDEKHVAVCHGHTESLEQFIHSGDYDYVFHGHTHRRRDERVGGTRVINPGALGGTKHEPRSLCILDLETGEAQFIKL